MRLNHIELSFFLEILIEFIKLLNILYIAMIINCWFIQYTTNCNIF